MQIISLSHAHLDVTRDSEELWSNQIFRLQTYRNLIELSRKKVANHPSSLRDYRRFFVDTQSKVDRFDDKNDNVRSPNLVIKLLRRR